MRALRDYRRYLVKPPESEAWGIAVTGCGRQTCPAGSPYPPAGHPADHHFSWANGRVLGAGQIVFVSEGRGVFESRALGQTEHTMFGCVINAAPGNPHQSTER